MVTCAARALKILKVIQTGRVAVESTLDGENEETHSEYSAKVDGGKQESALARSEPQLDGTLEVFRRRLDDALSLGYIRAR